MGEEGEERGMGKEEEEGGKERGMGRRERGGRRRGFLPLTYWAAV